MNVRKIVSIVWAALLPACWVQAQEPPALPCAKGDVKCASAERVKSPARTKSYWSAALAKPLDQRFGTAPDELLVFLNLDNIADEIPNSPRAAVLPVEFAKDVRDAIAGLPAEVKSAVDKKLAGIYFVKDLGGTGYTDYAHADGIGRDAGYVVLDMDVLQAQTANACKRNIGRMHRLYPVSNNRPESALVSVSSGRSLKINSNISSSR